MSRILLAFAILAACAPAQQAAEPAGFGDAEAIEALAREIAPRVSEIRGLAFRRDVAVRVVDDATAREHFRKRVLMLYPEERIEHDGVVLVQLGILPPGTRLLDALLDLLEEQAGGYYDPDSDTFFVLDDVPPETAPILMAHELTHALDDQHFDIDGLLSSGDPDDDRTTALAALVEGSGMAVMSVFLVREIQAGRLAPDVLARIQESEAGRAQRLRAAPPYIQRSLMAPYTVGLNFVLRGDPQRLLSGAFREDLDRAFRDPPSSTEQILHPERYWNPATRDTPQRLSLPDLSPTLGAGWRLAASGRLGELSLGVLTGATAPDPASPDAGEPRRWTNDAAAGLAGDLYQHYVQGERRATLLATTWETTRDADDFLAALRALPGRRSFQSGERVVFVAGDLQGAQVELAQAAMSGLRVGE